MASKKAGSGSAIKAAAVALAVGAGRAAVRTAAAGGTRRASGADAGGADALLQAVAEQMPGWKLAGPVRNTAAITHSDDPQRSVDSGASLSDLRRKFLGTVDNADAGDEQYQAREAGVAVFRIEPVGGGPSRVAELRGGKVRVVSG